MWQQVLVCIVLIAAVVVGSDDYYSLLGIGRDADNREIRKAFKKLALKYHPDKNDDEDAQEKFVKINKAYETLKDEDKRKRYDRFGEEDDDEARRHGGYQSWNYYHDDFGLYDDDPEVVTLDYHDFRRSVGGSDDIWFVNYYSPQCSHCHDLAPTWRRLARTLNGIVRVGAVNCQDEWQLCRQQNIHSYPSLMFYSPEGQLRYRGRKEEEDLIEFVSDNIPKYMIRLRTANWKKAVLNAKEKLPWVIFYCSDDDLRCPSRQRINLLANTMYGLVHLGLMDCNANKQVCQEQAGEETGAHFFETSEKVAGGNGTTLKSSDIEELSDEILELLPDVPTLDEERYSNIRLKLEDELGPSWLLQFVFGTDGITGQEKKIPALLGDKIKFGRVDCQESAQICKELLIKKPLYCMFKHGGGYEFHFGRDLPADVAAFAKASAKARNLKTLVASDFPELLDSQGVFVDFFAPWCPPCLNLLPEYRKAATIVGRGVIFGTVDCTTQQKVCDQYNIRSYPTTVFFNESKPHHYQGHHLAEDLADFVQEVLRPSVISLNHRSFYQLVAEKPENEIWVIDFFAPWCGPCMQLTSHWTKMAQILKRLPEVKVAKVDCTVENRLCQEQAVRTYPSIRMYPLGSPGISKYFVYTRFHRDAHSLKEWVIESMPAFVEYLNPSSFRRKVFDADSPSLVYFYLPWCGYCKRFSPKYDDISIELRNTILVSKIDCYRYESLCSEERISNHPTVRFYPGGSKRGQDLHDRSPEAILDFVKNKSLKRTVTHDEL